MAVELSGEAVQKNAARNSCPLHSCSQRALLIQQHVEDVGRTNKSLLPLLRKHAGALQSVFEFVGQLIKVNRQVLPPRGSKEIRYLLLPQGSLFQPPSAR